MSKKCIVRKIAVFILAIIFSENVIADTHIDKTNFIPEKRVELIDGEHTESAAEGYAESEEIASPSAVEVNKDFSAVNTDEVLSDAAIDYELETDGIPDYALSAAMSNSAYSALDESSKFYLNRYIGVREDTMTVCENNGLVISDSIPFALLMQRLNIDFSQATDMMIEYRSQTKALDEAMNYREKAYGIGFLSQEEFMPELTGLIIEGYSTEEVINSFAVAYCTGNDVKDLLTGEKIAIENNTEVFENTLERTVPMGAEFGIGLFSDKNVSEVTDESILNIANENSVHADYIADYMEENDLTVEDMQKQISAARVELGIDDESLSEDNNGGIQLFSEEAGEVINELGMDLDYKEGPFSFRKSMIDSVDTSSGSLSYTDNIASIPGLNGLDFNLSLIYHSKNNYASAVDKRINVGRNWQFSLPYLTTKSGSNITAVRQNNNIVVDMIPMYVVLADGSKYSIDDAEKTQGRRLMYCQDDDMYLNYDLNSKGGTDSFFELTHLDGTNDYFDKNGRWIKTINRFGNSIQVSEYSSVNNTDKLVIQDTLERKITITTVKTSTGYNQTILLPGSRTIEYTYETVTPQGAGTRTILTQKKEMADASKSLYTKYNYECINPDTGKATTNALLSSITFPTGMVSHYEYVWCNKYKLEPYVFQAKADGKLSYYMRISVRKYANDDPRVEQKWISVNGVNKNIEKYSYSIDNYSYKNGDVIIPNFKPSSDEIYGEYVGFVKDESYEARCKEKIDRAREILNEDNSSSFSSVSKLSTLNGAEKNHSDYAFDEYGRNISVKTYENGNLYSNIIKRYTNEYQQYPFSTITYAENTYIREEVGYVAGISYEKTIKDINDNIVYHEKTNYDYIRSTKSNYGLPKNSVRDINGSQSAVTDYTTTDNGRVIGEEKTYLQSGSTKTLKARTIYTYNSSMPGRLSQQKNYVNSTNYVTTSYTYNNSNAAPISQEYNDGTTGYKTSYEYDAVGRIKKVTSPMGFTTVYEYDKIGNITKETFNGGALSTVKSVAYDYTGNTITATNENGKRIKYTYDQAGNPTSVLDVENNNNPLEKYTYDAYMRLVTQISGAATTLTYDNRDRVTSKVINGGGNKLAQENYTYTSDGVSSTVVTNVAGDANTSGYSTSVKTDMLGRTSEEINRQGGVTTYTLDMAGNITKVVPPRVYGDYSISYTYDHAGNILTETETGVRVDTATKSYEYDMLGRVTGVVDGMGKKTTYSYCSTNWVKEIKTPFNGSSYGLMSYQYDKAGNVIQESVKVSSAASRITDYKYDPLNRVTESKINGVTTTYQYDKAGNMINQSMANGTQTVSYAYDQLNRPTRYTDGLGMTESYVYNNYGDMTSKKDRNGITTNYTYDALHRKTKESVTKDGKTSTNSFVYGLTGQLVSETNGKFARSYNYYKDNSGLYSDEFFTLDGAEYRIRRLYNDADQLQYVQCFKSGMKNSIYTKNYNFDSKGRIYMFGSQSASEYGDSTNYNYNAYYTYDKNDNITSVKVNNGLETTYSYNDANMLTALVNKKSTTTISSYSYSYNLDGNISRKTENGKTTDYIYDGTGRLSNEKITKGTAITNMSYSYDMAGNRSYLTVTGSENYVTSYSYDKNNRLLKESKRKNGASYADLTLYTYDNNGNQIRKDKSKDDLTGIPSMGFFSEKENSSYGYEKFAYNGFNQMTKYENEKNNIAEYDYLSNGLRLSKTVNGSKTSYIWDGSQMIMTVTADETRSYAKAPGYMRTGTSKELTGGVPRNDELYLFNGHGDVVGITDKSGNLEKSYEYDAFGNEINPNSNDNNPFRYCGEYWDSETGSIYLRARYYSPGAGRFTTEDPIRDGSNWYSYCGGNPVAFWDPSGLKGKKINVMKAKQNNDNNCWAAALAMVIAYEEGITAETDEEQKKITDDIQNQVVGYVEEAGRNVSAKTMGEVNNKLGRISIYEKEGSEGSGQKKYANGTEPIYYEKFPDVRVMEEKNIEGGELRSYIIDQIGKEHPVILLYNCGGAGHFVVVTGYDISGSNMTVTYNDPWTGTEETASIEEMKGYLGGVGYNYSNAYGIRDNEERFDEE